MKAAIGAVGAAVAASACCMGPVAFSLIGAGALGASAVKLEPYRPWFIGFAVMLVGVAFYSAYRPPSTNECRDGVCTAPSKRAAKMVVWIAAVIAALFIAFPYYVGWFV